MSTLTASHGLTLSNTGLKLIKAYEGYRPVDRILVSGQRVVGYGHRLYDDKPRQISKADAEALLISDLRAYEDMINENVHAPLTQGQFDALVSFAFNIGPKAFLASETLHAMNNGRPLDAANALDVWRKSTINGKTYIVDALMRRRTAEKALFLRTESFPCPASGIDLPPVRDENLAAIVLEKDFPVYDQKLTSGVVATAPFTLDELAEGQSETQDEAPDLQDFELNEDIASEPSRRRDDGPAGVLMLSEVAEAPVMKGPLIQEADFTKEELVIEDEIVTEDEIISEDETPLTLDQVSDDSDALGALVDDQTNIEKETALETLGTLENTELTDVNMADDNQVDLNRSVIAEAAADISERLDALIEDAKDPDKEMDWPDNLTNDEPHQDVPSEAISEAPPILLSEAISDSNDVLVLSSEDSLDAEIADASKSDNLSDDVQSENVPPESVSHEVADFDDADIKDSLEVEAETFGNEDKDRLDEADEAPFDAAKLNNITADNLEESTEVVESEEAFDPNVADIVIDNLAEDDAMRDHNDDMSIFYERHNLAKPEPETSNFGFWMIMLAGFILLGMTLAISLRGAEAIMGAWGPLVVISGVLIGALMVIGAAYYAIRHALSEI